MPQRESALFLTEEAIIQRHAMHVSRQIVLINILFIEYQPVQRITGSGERQMRDSGHRSARIGFFLRRFEAEHPYIDVLVRIPEYSGIGRSLRMFRIHKSHRIHRPCAGVRYPVYPRLRHFVPLRIGRGKLERHVDGDARASAEKRSRIKRIQPVDMPHENRLRRILLRVGRILVQHMEHDRQRPSFVPRRASR